MKTRRLSMFITATLIRCYFIVSFVWILAYRLRNSLKTNSQLRSGQTVQHPGPVVD